MINGMWSYRPQFFSLWYRFHILYVQWTIRTTHNCLIQHDSIHVSIHLMCAWIIGCRENNICSENVGTVGYYDPESPIPQVIRVDKWTLRRKLCFFMLFHTSYDSYHSLRPINNVTWCSLMVTFPTSTHLWTQNRFCMLGWSSTAPGSDWSSESWHGSTLSLYIICSV